MQGKLVIMEELGFIIAPNGKIFRFGEYKPYIKREEDSDYHHTAFKTEVATLDEWKSLGLPIPDDVDITASITSFASLGLVVGLNQTQGSFSASIPILLLASPDKLTDEQINTLLIEKEKLVKFDSNLAYVRIIDKEENTIDRPQFISDYYEKYVEAHIVELEQKRG